MNLLRWAPSPQADVVAYNVYRSIIGFMAPQLAPADLVDKTLILAVDGGAPETVTFSGDLSAIDDINAQMSRGTAYPSITDPLQFIFRSATRQAPGSVQIIGGSALALLQLVPDMITEKSEEELLAVLQAAPNSSDVVTFDDTDGVSQDWYAVSTVASNGLESFRTDWRQPTTTTGPVCVIEGIVADLQGLRIPDCEVRATVQNMPLLGAPGLYLSRKPVCTMTREDGRFSLALLQGAEIFLEIPQIGYSLNTLVPPQAYVFLSDLAGDLTYRMPVDFK